MALVTLARLLGTPDGRKGIAFTQSLLVLVLLGAAAVLDGGLSHGELDSLLWALAGILATFSGANVGEHVAARPKAAP